MSLMGCGVECRVEASMMGCDVGQRWQGGIPHSAAVTLTLIGAYSMTLWQTPQHVWSKGRYHMGWHGMT